ncbi:MAG: (d)CMP kinase [Alphaproteobacteria bacterium]|nr:(d)CMP kinase [Alphaproteobacteria bacterium]
MIIAVDGPVAAGKGTLARRLAAALGYDYLDTGLLYRGVAFRVLAAGGDPGDGPAAAAAAATLTADELGRPELRGERVGEAASQVAAQPAVRAALLAFQRGFACRPPGGRGAVLDGRDIGTVVCPGAAVKLFVTASEEARVQRRHRELLARGQPAPLSEVRADLRRRDQRDSQRAIAPLAPAAGAHLLDTTGMSIEAAFAAAMEIISAQLLTDERGSPDPSRRS